MRVVSWNIHWGCGKDGRIRIHAIIDVLRRLNPDVICLQEVAANHPELEGNASANQFKQLAGAFGGYHAVWSTRQRDLPEQCPAPVRQPDPVQVPHFAGAPSPAAVAARPGASGRHAARPDRNRRRSAGRQAAPAHDASRILFARPAHGAGQPHPRTALPRPAHARCCSSPIRTWTRRTSWAFGPARPSCAAISISRPMRRITRRCWPRRKAARWHWSMPGAWCTATWRARRPPACTAIRGPSGLNATIISSSPTIWRRG